MKNIFNAFGKKTESKETIDKNISKSQNTLPEEETTPKVEGDNLIKMKEATKLLKASPPTVRKYAKLGFYKEYRFGEKLVYYNREEILNFILKQNG
jgi:predicted DNA-binding transcriptional regulator AlpA